MTPSLPSSSLGQSSERGTCRPRRSSRLLRVVSNQGFFFLFASFVVSNVGEFSRTILGSHFKHNNVRLSFSV
jgi:hypothetical protein